jgi:hypothetical protein
MGILDLSPSRTDLQIHPDVLHAGDRLRIAFVAPALPAGPREAVYEVTVSDDRRRHVATVVSGRLRPAGGVLVAEWDGCDERGHRVPPGAYRLRVARPGSPFWRECSLHVAG